MSDEYKMSEPLTNYNTVFSKYPRSGFNGFYCDEEMSYDVYIWIKAHEESAESSKKEILHLKELIAEGREIICYLSPFKVGRSMKWLNKVKDI